MTDHLKPGDDLEHALEERLVRYVQIDSQSDEQSPTTPSTESQWDVLNLLVQELNDIGASDVRLTEYGAVLATIPSTVTTEAPTVAFLAHVDTAPAFSGAGIQPVVHRNWEGHDITFIDAPDLVLSANDYPYLAQLVGDDIVTASGGTLLGADDKAGVAIIMEMARHLLSNSEIEHGPIRICFTPDEEIGRGVHPQLPADLGAAVAYTLDGGEVGSIVFETFSADKATVSVQGVATHPGDAKDELVNALHLAAKIVTTLPHVTMTPETTDGRLPFIHLYDMSGTAAEVTLNFILRAFELDELEAQRELIESVCKAVGLTEPRARISCDISSQYRNMRYWLENDMRPVEVALEACREMDIEPFSFPTRGGTDGSRLTELGVPTPNLFTGMQNIHGPLEYISVQDMAKATELCIRIAHKWSLAK